MDSSDLSRAPPEFREIAWICVTCKALMGVGWLTNYIGMIYKSNKEKTYGMALMPLCCNFAWELTYMFIYPFQSSLEKRVHTTGLALNCLVMYTALRYAHGEWTHAPLVQRNLPLIFFICVLGFTSGHVAFAAQLGPSLAQAWGAFACQLLLSVGGLCQLITRGHSRGASYTLWLARFLGSLVLVPQDYLRWKYWREDHEWLASPVYIWFITIFLLLDGSYGIVLYYVRRYERGIAKNRKPKKM